MRRFRLISVARLRTIPIGASATLVPMTDTPNRGPFKRIRFTITSRINAPRQVWLINLSCPWLIIANSMCQHVKPCQIRASVATHRCNRTDTFYTRIEWFPVPARLRRAVRRPVIWNVISVAGLTPFTQFPLQGRCNARWAAQPHPLTKWNIHLTLFPTSGI